MTLTAPETCDLWITTADATYSAYGLEGYALMDCEMDSIGVHLDLCAFGCDVDIWADNLTYLFRSQSMGTRERTPMDLPRWTDYATNIHRGARFYDGRG